MDHGVGDTSFHSSNVAAVCCANVELAVVLMPCWTVRGEFLDQQKCKSSVFAIVVKYGVEKCSSLA